MRKWLVGIWWWCRDGFRGYGGKLAGSGEGSKVEDFWEDDPTVIFGSIVSEVDGAVEVEG